MACNILFSTFIAQNNVINHFFMQKNYASLLVTIQEDPVRARVPAITSTMASVREHTFVIFSSSLFCTGECRVDLRIVILEGIDSYLGKYMRFF